MEDASSVPPLDFFNIDADARRFRRYRLWLQPDLFGRTALIREWGRIGQPGTVRIATYGRGDNAAKDFRREVRRRLQRGYRPTPATAAWLEGAGAIAPASSAMPATHCRFREPTRPDLAKVWIGP